MVLSARILIGLGLAARQHDGIGVAAQRVGAHSEIGRIERERDLPDQVDVVLEEGISPARREGPHAVGEILRLDQFKVQAINASQAHDGVAPVVATTVLRLRSCTLASLSALRDTHLVPATK